MEENTNHVSDDTKVAIPIRNLISIIGAVVVSTWAYNGITERLDFLEYKYESMIEEVEENDSWIDANHNKESIIELEIRMSVAEEKINNGGL